MRRLQMETTLAVLGYDRRSPMNIEATRPERQFSIAHLMLCTAVLAALIAFPRWLAGITIRDTIAFWLVFAHQIVLGCAISYALWLTTGRRKIVPIVLGLALVITYAPAVAMNVEQTIYGHCTNTMLWLMDHGLYYTPPSLFQYDLNVTEGATA